MTKEDKFIMTFEEWYEYWFEKPFPTDKEEAEKLKADHGLQKVYEYSCKLKTLVEKEIEKALEVLMNHGNLFFKDYEGKVSSISYCDIDNGKIFFME